MGDERITIMVMNAHDEPFTGTEFITTTFTFAVDEPETVIVLSPEPVGFVGTEHTFTPTIAQMLEGTDREGHANLITSIEVEVGGETDTIGLDPGP